ncbi:hypothetical protein ACFL20_02705 [Spirochaetota bacterium]
MALKDGKDFLIIKNAFYSEDRMVRQSGVLVITGNRLILKVLQTVDPLDAMTGGEPSIKEAINEIKDGPKEIEKGFNKIFEYSKKKKEIEGIAEACTEIDDFERRVDAMGPVHPKNMNIRIDNIKKYKSGFFNGLRIYMEDGKVWKIRTGKLGKIKSFINANK